MEDLGIDRNFWFDKRVLVTGHTGFKGTWLCLWLQQLGSRVVGYALAPPTDPSAFEAANVSEGMHHIEADIRDRGRLRQVFQDERPEIVIHMAAQSLVRRSHADPAETYDVNVMGTVRLLDAIRSSSSVRAVLVVTSDKCYENREWVWGYRESEPLGGYDPYSSSKACQELVASAYRQSFFHPDRFTDHGVALATARAGNVIGGGDWSDDRLLPDIARALTEGEEVLIRNPRSIRPWQHVLEPLRGYLLLLQRLWSEGPAHTGAWNFGPNDKDNRSVRDVTDRFRQLWGGGAVLYASESTGPHEAALLKLDCSKARQQLEWWPRWDLDKALETTVDWYRAFNAGDDMKAYSMCQIDSYENP